MAICSHCDVMATLTIRNLPDELHLRLKAQARRNRRSVNQEVIAEIGRALEDSSEFAKKEHVRRMIALAAELRKKLKHPLNPEEIRAGIEEWRK